MHRLIVRLAAVAAIVTAALAAAAPLQAVPNDDRYTVAGIVSDLGTLAPNVDPNLHNGWGLTASPTSPWWVSDNDTNKASLYTASGTINALAPEVDGGPTGTVFAGIAGEFQVGTATAPTTLAPASFIFASQDGKIRAWRGGTAALVTASAPTPGASYFGLAISGTGSDARIYAADFANRHVDVFDGSWNVATAPGAFTEPHLPADYGPFGIQTIGNRVFVAFAEQGPDGDEVHAPGAGIVDAFDLNGTFLSRVASHGDLNAPWGLALAPASGFGPFSGDLLIGNFGDGTIQAMRERPDGTWDHEGLIRDSHRLKVTIDGLWALQFGHGSANNGPATTLFFTAGPNDEVDGLFGSITPVATPTA